VPDTKDNARNELLYVSTSEPATEAAARLPGSYTRAGMVKSDSLQVNVNMIDANDKDVGDFNAEIPGRSSGQIQIAGNRPKDGNAGQIIIRNARAAGTKLYFLKSDNVIGDIACHGSAYVSAYQEGSDDEAIRAFSATLSLQEEPTWFEIQT
jgi:hypothetical protein